MKNKVAVTIAGQEYNMLAVEDEAYVRRCAAFVDKQVREVQQAGRLSVADAAILAAMNLSDLYLKEQESAENLRRQITSGTDATAKELSECKRELNECRRELGECKRELFRLKGKP